MLGAPLWRARKMARAKWLPDGPHRGLGAEPKGSDSRQLTVELGKKRIETHFIINGLKGGTVKLTVKLTVELGKKRIKIHFVINGLKDRFKLGVSDYAVARLRQRACR
jgi:hypothetical protein